MRPNKYYVLFSLALFTVLVFCGKETILYDSPEFLEAEEFTFIPEKPKANKNVSMVFYGCGYYETKSVLVNSPNIWVVKKFNGAMRRPCILEFDTISLGNLKAGQYEVTLQIIDTNSFAPDSLFYSESKILSVR